MNKLWAGRTEQETAQLADAFNSSIAFDSRMFREDITGSMAHAAMLGARGILGGGESEKLIDGLQGILDELDSGALAVDPAAEDIHMFIEQELTARLGELGKKLHTARSRNDQVALDLRMYLRAQTDELLALTKELASVLCDKAEEYKAAIMPGYTHLQRAQPVTFGHHLLAYAFMLLRDAGRLSDCRGRMNLSPIGCCALAGTSHDIDRALEAERLGFAGICQNSVDGVSDRDFAAELCAALAIEMMHLSRLAEELVLWSSWEFRFIELPDAYTTGSSIMPQKKNPDMAELVRGKTGRVYGDLMGLLTVLKGLPLAYNKDMQEDKEGVFDACDTVKSCLAVLTGMLPGMKADTGRMLRAAGEGFLNATDLADYLVSVGLPFRSAYQISGRLVAKCIREGKLLETLTLEEYREASPLIGREVYEWIDLRACVERRRSAGGTCVSSVEAQLRLLREQLRA